MIILAVDTTNTIMSSTKTTETDIVSYEMVRQLYYGV